LILAQKLTWKIRKMRKTHLKLQNVWSIIKGEGKQRYRILILFLF
jgi:hypothetical protein